jgi:prepilin-type N-terminal cleavage/methylation domain-containing protein
MSIINSFKKLIFKKLIKSKILRGDKSFTLIELLVVISIISILSSAVLASVSSARDKSYNSYVTQLMRQYILAFELYKNDNKTYPTATTGWNCLGEGYSGGICGYINSPGPATENAIINNNIRPYIKPTKLTKAIGIGSGCTAQDIIDWGCVPGPPDDFVGIQYICTIVNNNICTKNALVWALLGNVKCNIEKSTTINIGQNTICFINLVDSYGAN